jgi:hypothetical protein
MTVANLNHLMTSNHGTQLLFTLMKGWRSVTVFYTFVTARRKHKSNHILGLINCLSLVESLNTYYYYSNAKAKKAMKMITRVLTTKE